MTGALRALVLAARPRTLPAAAAPVLVGCAIVGAHAPLQWLPSAATLLFALLIQVGTNYVNDVADFERGTDTDARVGPLRATQAGLLSPRAVKIASACAFGAAALVGVYLTSLAGWPLVVIGALSILSGIAYTAGPAPLAYNGLGDLFVMIFFGFVAVCGTAFIQLGTVPPLAYGAALPIGALTTAILAVNNVRDAPTDRKAGRRTLPVVLGRRAGVVEYVVLLAIAYATLPALVVLDMAPVWILLPLASLPRGVALARALARTDGPALNGVLAGTAQLLLLYALLFATGLAIPRL